MKWLLFIWLISAGIGYSYSVVMERKYQITLLKTMEYIIGQLAYYMYQWRMPVEETLNKLLEEENLLTPLLENIYETLKSKEPTALEEVWKENSTIWLKKEKISEHIKMLWTGLFLHLPMESKEIYDRLILKKEELTSKREELEQKYKGEQRLVMSMGLFAGLFFCLIV